MSACVVVVGVVVLADKGVTIVSMKSLKLEIVQNLSFGTSVHVCWRILGSRILAEECFHRMT